MSPHDDSKVTVPETTLQMRTNIFYKNKRKQPKQKEKEITRARRVAGIVVALHLTDDDF